MGWGFYFKARANPFQMVLPTLAAIILFFFPLPMRISLFIALVLARNRKVRIAMGRIPLKPFIRIIQPDTCSFSMNLRSVSTYRQGRGFPVAETLGSSHMDGLSIF